MLAALVLLLAGLAFAGDQHSQGVDLSGLAPDPCGPIIEGSLDAGANRITEAGIPSDATPEFLYETYTAGGLYCLSSPLAGRVDGVYQEFWNGEQPVARWLLANPLGGSPDDWEKYLRSLEPRAITAGMTFVELFPHGYLAVLDTPDASRLIRAVNPSSGASLKLVSLWEQVGEPLAHNAQGLPNG